MNELSSLLGYLDNVRFDVDDVDIKVWEEDSSGFFSVKSLYKSFFPINAFPLFSYFQSIWTHKVQVFSWTVALGKLPTCDMLQKRWPTCALCSNWCVVYRKEKEAQDHMLMHCPSRLVFGPKLWRS